MAVIKKMLQRCQEPVTVTSIISNTVLWKKILTLNDKNYKKYPESVKKGLYEFKIPKRGRVKIIISSSLKTWANSYNF